MDIGYVPHLEIPIIQLLCIYYRYYLYILSRFTTALKADFTTFRVFRWKDPHEERLNF